MYPTLQIFTLLLTLLTLLTPPSSFAKPSDTQNTPSPAQQNAIDQLKEGHRRFLQKPQNQDLIKQIKSQGNQTPFATILACSDSRITPEHCFDMDLGDLFVARIAGNVATTGIVATIEYGVDYLQTPILVVLGHTNCGAVSAVLQNKDVQGHIPYLLLPIENAASIAKQSDSNNLLQATIVQNVWESIQNVIVNSPIVRKRLQSGKLYILGAVYDIHSGEIQWLGTHPLQEKLLSNFPTDS